MPASAQALKSSGSTLEAAAALAGGDPSAALRITADRLAATPQDLDALYLRAAAARADGDEETWAATLKHARKLFSEQMLNEAGVDMARLQVDGAYAMAIGRTFYNQWNMGAASVALTHAACSETHGREAQFVLAQALHYMGRVSDSEAVFRMMLDAQPEPALHGYLLYSLFFRGDGGRAHAEEVRRWSKLWVDPSPPPPPIFHVQRRSDRPLRIGYLMPTFTNQLRQFLTPVLENHDLDQFEIFLYVDDASKEVELPGIVQRSVGNITHRATAQLMRADKLDVLVDLHGHFRLGRPTTVAQKPAPVQVSWMDYTHSVGLEAMDYVLHGDQMDVPGTQDLFVETVYNIGKVLVPFRPDQTARVAPAPCAARGYLTFGCFNHPAKLTDPTVAAWARILNARPEARLVLKYSTFADPVTCAETTARFVALGARVEQLLFRGHSKGEPYEQSFAEIDIALDPSPVTGGTTTMEALSRGVPVISLKGDDFYARVGAHTLAAIGMTELLADSWDDYVRLGCELAADLPRVQALREQTRPALDNSPYRDEVGFTRRLEAAFREMFDRWLASADGAPSSLPDGVKLTPDEMLLIAKTELLDGRADAALARLDAALKHVPANAETHYLRASALIALGQVQAGVAALDDARVFHTVEVLRGMGLDVGRMRGDPAYAGAVGAELYRHKLVALASLAFGFAVTSDSTELALLNLGLSLQHQGRAEDAANTFRAAADLDGSAGAYQFLLYSLFFVKDGVRRYAAEARAWAQRFTSAIEPLSGPFANDLNPDRRLRIGFVAPSFTRSQLKQFIMPVVRAHDRAAVELFFYSADPAAEDGLPDTVRGIGQMSDEAAAQAIRADRIDILIDLWGFTAGGRPRVFAYKPAPVQASWINMAQTMGMETIDYVFHADSMAAPGTDALFAEQVLHVGDVTVPYQPSPDRLPPTPTPALANGVVTFGSFHNPVRISDETVAAWAAILKGRHGSRLLFKYGYYADPVLQRVTQARFAAHGVDPARLFFQGHSTGAEYFGSFGLIDLALDPSPCPGGTTTCDALANSVPVLTLRGPDFYSRIGVQTLQAFPELIAEDWGDYIERALGLTEDAQALDALRARVRPTFEASPACDADGFTRKLERVYRDIFADWARRQG